MNSYTFDKEMLNKLWLAHHSEPNKQAADRIKAVYLLGMGWSIDSVATALLLSENSIRNYYQTYESGGLKALLTFNYQNNRSYLSEKELKQLEAHLEKVVYVRVQDIISYVKKTFQVSYSRNGMRDLLHRLNFVYKKPKLIPAKTDMKAQQEFVKKYREIERDLGPEDSLYFMDATHPHYQTVTGYGWIKQGSEVKLPTVPRQTALHINGAINIKKLQGVFQCEKGVLTREHTIDLLSDLRKKQPKGYIYIISDRGGCNYAEDVKKYAEAVGIKLIYLPPYSPNLNIIERLWLFFKKKVLYNRTYDNFEDFCKACKKFFKNISTYESELRTLLTDNFQIISN